MYLFAKVYLRHRGYYVLEAIKKINLSIYIKGYYIIYKLLFLIFILLIYYLLF